MPYPYRVARYTDTYCRLIGNFDTLTEALNFRDEWQRLDPHSKYKIIDNEED